MARIRTVKPEFWISEQVAECSTNARLLFVGLWNFCDDGGVHPSSVRRLKMEVFPGDDFTLTQIQEWIEELITNGLIVEFIDVEAVTYWQVTGWHHQKIDRPRLKYPQFEDQSSTVRRGVDEELSSERRKEGIGRDSIGEERKGVEGSGNASNPRPLCLQTGKPFQCEDIPLPTNPGDPLHEPLLAALRDHESICWEKFNKFSVTQTASELLGISQSGVPPSKLLEIVRKTNVIGSAYIKASHLEDRRNSVVTAEDLDI